MITGISVRLAGAGCTGQAGHPAPAAVAAVERDPFRSRAEQFPFAYERGETSAGWPVETTGGGVGLLERPRRPGDRPSPKL
jgi:hypothetical protein